MSNITGLTSGNITTFLQLIEYNNTVTNNLFSGLFLLAVTFIVLVQLLKHSEPRIAIMITSFIMSVLSLLFVAINLSNPIFVYIFALALIFSVIYNYITP